MRRSVALTAALAGLAVPASAQAAVPPDSGVRHIITESTGGGSAPKTEQWLDADSMRLKIFNRGGSLTTENAQDATGFYLFEKARNLVTFAKEEVVGDQADPRTFGVEQLSTQGTETVNGVEAVHYVGADSSASARQTYKPGTSVQMSVREELWVSVATGRLVRKAVVHDDGSISQSTDVVRDEVLADTPANHRLADVPRYAGARRTEVKRSAGATKKGAKKGRRAAGKRRKSASR